MEHTVQHSTNGTGHEHSEVSVRLIVISLAFLAVFTLLVCILVVGIFNYLHTEYRTAEEAKQTQPVIPPEPRLQVEGPLQLQQLHAHEDHVLTTYAWVDQKNQTVRIPIDRAIDLLAQKGLPSHNYLDDILAGRKPPAAKAPADPGPQGSTNAR